MLLAAGSCRLAMAQTNAPASPETAAAQKTFLTSESAVFDGNNRQMIYAGHVVVVNPKVRLTCDQLTVNLPPGGGQPTNMVADTNVVADFTDNKGQTNHVTSAQAVYDYKVENSITNETVTFIGNPIVETADYTIFSEPLVWDRARNKFHFKNEKIVPKHSFDSGNGTNTSPLKLF